MPGLGAANAIDIRAGETVLIIPATGYFSSSAVVAVLGLGANIIIGGRNKKSLRAMIKHFGEDGKRMKAVVLTGEAGMDSKALMDVTPRGKGADAYIDYSPRTAGGTTHIMAGLLALKKQGR